MAEITVFCENCGDEILEKHASCLYHENGKNYMILCTECYDKLLKERVDN